MFPTDVLRFSECRTMRNHLSETLMLNDIQITSDYISRWVVFICDVASFRLFKPVRSEPLHENNRKFLHIPFANNGIDAINISNILNRKEVVKEIPHF
jgi:hypothetical protein